MIDTGKYIAAAQAAAQGVKDQVLDAVRATRQRATESRPAAKADEPRRTGCLFAILNIFRKKDNPSPAPVAAGVTRQDDEARLIISDALRTAHRRACDDWAALLDRQGRQLVAEIEAQPGVDHIDKVRQSESVTARSVLSFSLLAEGANMRKAEALSTPQGFDNYVASFATRYAQAVDAALSQQLEIYKRLEK